MLVAAAAVAAVEARGAARRHRPVRPTGRLAQTHTRICRLRLLRLGFVALLAIEETADAAERGLESFLGSGNVDFGGVWASGFSRI